MEIYTIYRGFVSIFATVRGLEQVDGKMLFTALGIGGGIWLVLFVLQGFGLYAMAKKREMKNKWLAFVPFASVWYMGKLAGACDVFGKKMKRPGLYTMISQILTALVCAATITVEILLFTKYGTEEYKVIGEYGVQWSNLPTAGRYAFNFYVISDYILSIVQLVYLVLLFILLMGLYKKYYTRGYMLLSFVALLSPCRDISQYSSFATIKQSITKHICVPAERNLSAVNNSKILTGALLITKARTIRGHTTKVLIIKVPMGKIPISLLMAGRRERRPLRTILSRNFPRKGTRLRDRAKRIGEMLRGRIPKKRAEAQIRTTYSTDREGIDSLWARREKIKRRK